MRDLHSAQLYFGEWQRGENRVESAFLTRLADDVRERIRKLQGDFRVAFSEKTMEAPEVLHRQLNRWLILWARERSSNNVEKARKLLGVSKQTFYNWERGEDEPSRFAAVMHDEAIGALATAEPYEFG